jgi:hypothetical protein
MNDQMKKILAGVAITAALTVPAIARPQLHTQSIGWIDPTDISCEQTSDHTCIVTEGCGDCSPLAYTWQEQHGERQKYQVRTGTELVVVNEGKNNEAESDDQRNVWMYRERVEVAIVIPADWHDGSLRPDKFCHLAARGKFSQIVSMLCR